MCVCHYERKLSLLNIKYKNSQIRNPCTRAHTHNIFMSTSCLHMLVSMLSLVIVFSVVLIILGTKITNKDLINNSLSFYMCSPFFTFRIKRYFNKTVLKLKKQAIIMFIVHMLILYEVSKARDSKHQIESVVGACKTSCGKV